MEAKRKSTILDIIVLTINISLGKYILLNKVALFTKALVLVVSEFAKSVHGNSPAYKNTEYGTPSSPNLNMCENTNDITDICISGFKITQAYPSTDCLYRAFISLFVSTTTSSQKCLIYYIMIACKLMSGTT